MSCLERCLQVRGVLIERFHCGTVQVMVHCTMQVCMASIISMGNGSLVFANPASKTERANGTLRRRCVHI